MPVSNKTFLHFGKGDIAVGVIHNNDMGISNELIFKQVEAGPIGRDNNELIGMDLRLVEYDVRMLFDCIESLDVVLNKLNEIRNSMVEYEIHTLSYAPNNEGDKEND